MSFPVSGARPSVGFAGLGMIGGSFALALREAGVVGAISAWDHNPQVAVEARQAGVMDRVCDSFSELCEAVDLVVLAAPTEACAGLLQEALADRYDCYVTDVASVKAPLVAVAEKASPARAARYVPGHPIAGSERSGFASGRAELFRAHRVILTPRHDTESEAIEALRDLWVATGASVHLMEASHHDAILADTSHLPHMLAFALVDALASSPSRQMVFEHAAGGFRDFTRIAASSPVMWRDIALANRDALLASMDLFELHYQRMREAVMAGDASTLESMFSNAKTARDEFSAELERRRTPGTIEQRRS